MSFDVSGLRLWTPVGLNPVTGSPMLSRGNWVITGQEAELKLGAIQ